MDAIAALGKAVSILSKEMAKNPASLAQVDMSSMDGVLHGLSAVMDAAGFSGDDALTLSSLLQAQNSEDDEELGAPKGAAYKSHSKGIFDVLQDMKQKAQTQLSNLRKAAVK